MNWRYGLLYDDGLTWLYVLLVLKSLLLNKLIDSSASSVTSSHALAELSAWLRSIISALSLVGLDGKNTIMLAPFPPDILRMKVVFLITPNFASLFNMRRIVIEDLPIDLAIVATLR